MSVTITVPKNDTNIQLNIAGKSVSEVGSELETLGLMLKAIASTDSSFESGFAYKDEEHDIPHPLPHINYREWEDDLETCFSSNSIIRGYFVEGDMVNVDVDPEFMKWARTDKPLDEFCKEQHDALRTYTADTPQTERSE